MQRAFERARLALPFDLSNGDEPRHGLIAARDDYLFSSGGLPDQPGESGLCFMYGDNAQGDYLAN